MKTIRTIFATFGVTSALYGLFALIAVRLNPAFTGRSIYQMFRDTGFVALVIGIGCILSFVIMTVAIVSFREEGARRKHDFTDDESEEEFLEEETVPEDRAEEADESWSPEIKRKQRRALRHTDEEPTPDLFGDDEDEETIPIRSDREPEADTVRTIDDEDFAPEPVEPEEPDAAVPETEENAAIPSKRCIYCGKMIDADSAFCIYCGTRV